MQVRSAIRDLQPYVPGRLKEGAVKLASNENPLGTSPLAVAALQKLSQNVSLYPDGASAALKAALAEKHQITPAQIVVGNGSDEVLVLITGAYIEPGDTVIVSEGTFSEYNFAARLFGADVRKTPLIDGCYQLDMMADLAAKGAKMVFLCNPNNPTGTYFSHDALRAFLKRIPAEILVVLDEAYAEYTTAADYPDSLKLLKEYSNLMILRTFSKIYGLAGLRVGYAMGSAEVVSGLNKAREPFNVNSMAQAAALAALGDTDFYNRSRAVNEAGIQWLYGQFDSMGLKYYKTQANFIFVDLKDYDGTDAFEGLMELGVTIRPMKSFGYNSCIRVTVGTQEQNELFIRCLKTWLSRAGKVSV